MSRIHDQVQLQRSNTPTFLAKRIGHFYGERVTKSWQGGHILRGRAPVMGDLLLQSNDYLALTLNHEIVEAQISALRSEGNGAMMSAIFLHGDTAHSELENRFANHLNSEAAILCQSGYAANVGLLQSIADKDTPVYIDHLAHMSLWEGAKSAGTVTRPFRHNDPAHLERQMAAYGPGIVAVDALYSTTGDIAPIRDLVAVTERHGGILVVDESHSLGTHGPKGEGIVAEMGLADRVPFRTASLAKAFCARAGVIACPRHFYDYFRFESRPAIFSSTLLPHELAGINRTLEVIRRDGWRREMLRDVSEGVRTALREIGYHLNGSESHIIPLETGTEKDTIIARDFLEARGVFGAVFCAPATPKTRALIRFSLHCALTGNEAGRLIAACLSWREWREINGGFPSDPKGLGKSAYPNLAVLPHPGGAGTPGPSPRPGKNWKGEYWIAPGVSQDNGAAVNR